MGTLFRKENNSDVEKKLIPAPHWKTLNVYGGNLSIEEFRKNFSVHRI